MADDPMWCLVLFDLPVTTVKERREAHKFRYYLLDHGFVMVQFSVYVKYWPTGGIHYSSINGIKGNLPAGGQVRIVFVTDRQWSSALCFENEVEQKKEETPQQLLIF